MTWKEPTKKELKEWIRNERNVFLDSFFDLLKQRKELEEKVQRLQEQLHEANMVILSLPAEKISTCMIACEYLDKWGIK